MEIDMTTDSIVTFGLDIPVRMVFANLFEAKRVKINGKETGEPKFSATFLIPPDHPDFTVLVEKAKAVAAAKWPGRSYKELKRPFTDGDQMAAKATAKKKDGSFYTGQVVLKASSQFPPTLVDASRNPVAETVNRKLFYSGAFVQAEVNFVAYDGVGNNPDGITAYLNAVAFVRDGERIAGRDATKSFKFVQGAKTADNPAAGTEDDDEPAY